MSVTPWNVSRPDVAYAYLTDQAAEARRLAVDTDDTRFVLC